MKIPIQRIISNKKLKVYEEVKKVQLGKEISLISPIQISGTLEYVGNEEVCFNGHISTKVELTCVRCLKKFEQTLEINFSESYVPQYFSSSAPAKEERELEELNVFTYEGNFIDLDKIARDILIEHIPPYPLCPECRANT